MDRHSRGGLAGALRDHEGRVDRWPADCRGSAVLGRDTGSGPGCLFSSQASRLEACFPVALAPVARAQQWLLIHKYNGGRDRAEC